MILGTPAVVPGSLLVRGAPVPRTVADMATFDDSEIAARLAAARAVGDDVALSAAAWDLIECHMAGLRWHARRYCRDSWGPGGFDDFLAELTVAAHGAASRWDPSQGAGALAWMLRSGQNAVRSVEAQRRVVGPKLTAEGARVVEFDVDAAAPEVDEAEGVTDAARLRVLGGLIAGLPEPDRSVLVRSLGLDGDEPVLGRVLAAELGVTRQQVSNVLSRALSRLAHPMVLRRVVRAR